MGEYGHDDAYYYYYYVGSSVCVKEPSGWKKGEKEKRERESRPSSCLPGASSTNQSSFTYRLCPLRDHGAQLHVWILKTSQDEMLNFKDDINSNSKNIGIIIR